MKQDKTVIEIISGILALTPDEISPQAFLHRELMADSLDLVEISMALEDEFNLELSDEVIEKWRTVQDILDYINQETIA